MDALLQMAVIGVSNAAIYVLLGISVSIIFGILGVLNFAQGDFMTIASYVGYTVIVGLSVSVAVAVVFILPVLVAVGVVFYFGVLRPMRRHQDEMVLIATFGVALLIQGVVGTIWGGVPIGVERMGGAWRFGNVTITYVSVINMGLAVLAIVGVGLLLSRTSLGRAMRATAQDRDGAQLSGVNTGQVELAAVVLAVALSGLAGIMILQSSVLTPIVGFDLVLKAFAVAIVAGIGRIEGLVPAALTIGILESAVSTYYSASIATATVFATVVVTLVIRPSGFAGRRVRV